MVEEIIIDRLLKNSPLSQFTKDSNIGMGWAEVRDHTWWIVAGVMFMLLPVVFMITEKGCELL